MSPRTALPALPLPLALAATPAFAQPRPGAKYALLVGVDRYDPKELTNLRYPVRDVTDLADALLKSGYRKEDVVLLTSQRGAEDFRYTPTANHVLDELDLMLARANPEDTVILGFAGH